MTRCDLFCNIIDNYGDIGVCWRLARQLAAEHRLEVTLWVNDLGTFARLAPALNPILPRQALGGIMVCHWAADMESANPGDMVIEGFGCALPPVFLHAMAARQPTPVWFNLEYLSAEAWVDDCHGLPSLHPACGLTQHFWFPGFTAHTGGLLREAGLLAERDAFQTDPEAQAAFWAGLGLPEAMAMNWRVSLFAYENPAVARLLQALADAATSTLLVVPAGRVLGDVARWAGLTELKIGDRLVRGALTIAVLPMLDTQDYDRLLWACDLNAVRGEDSFVRAQWAGRPLLWHIYPQEEASHLVKLEAFIHRVSSSTAMPALWAELMRCWNGVPTPKNWWPALPADLPVLAQASRDWTAGLAARQDLCTGLMHFYHSQVE